MMPDETSKNVLTKAEPGLLEAFGVAWRSMPDKAFFLICLAAWLAFFHFLGNSTLGYVDTRSLFLWMDYAYGQSADDSHGKLIPFVVAGFLWWKRREILEAPKRVWWFGMGMVAVALLMHVFGYLIQQTRLSILAFFFGVYGVVGLVWGPAVLRITFFPFILFAFCFPLGTLAESVTFPLRMIATKITVFITGSILGIPILQNGAQILDAKGGFQFEVAAACSGLRSLTATMALATIHAFVNFQSPWRRIVLLASAFPLAVSGNVVRLSSIIIVAEAFGQQAGNFVHDNSLLSLIPYVPALGGLFILGWLMEPKKPKPATTTKVDAEHGDFSDPAGERGKA